MLCTRKQHNVVSQLYFKKRHKQTHRESSNLWVSEAGGRGRGNWRKRVKKHKLSVIRQISLNT